MNSYVPVERTLPPLWPPAIWAQSVARRRLQLPRRRRPPRSCRRRRRQGRRRPPKPRRQRRPAGRGRCRYCGADTICVRKQRYTVLLRSTCFHKFQMNFLPSFRRMCRKSLAASAGAGAGGAAAAAEAADGAADSSTGLLHWKLHSRGPCLGL